MYYFYVIQLAYVYTFIVHGTFPVWIVYSVLQQS